jgi:hypothetical protein
MTTHIPADGWYHQQMSNATYQTTNFLLGLNFTKDEIKELETFITDEVTKLVPSGVSLTNRSYTDNVLEQITSRLHARYYQNVKYLQVQQAQPDWLQWMIRLCSRQQQDCRTHSPSQPQGPGPAPTASSTMAATPSVPAPPPAPASGLDLIMVREPIAWEDLEVQIFLDHDPEPAHVNLLESYAMNGHEAQRTGNSYSYESFLQDIRQNCAYTETHVITYPRLGESDRYMVHNEFYWRAGLVHMRRNNLGVLRFHLQSSMARPPPEGDDMLLQGNNTSLTLAENASAPHKRRRSPDNISNTSLGPSQPKTLKRALEPLPPIPHNVMEGGKGGSLDNMDVSQTPEYHEQVPGPEDPAENEWEPMPGNPYAGGESVSMGSQIGGVSSQVDSSEAEARNLLDFSADNSSHGGAGQPASNTNTGNKGIQPSDSKEHSVISISSGSEPDPEPEQYSIIGISAEEDNSRQLSAEEIAILTERLRDFGAINHENIDTWREMCQFFKVADERQFGPDALIPLPGMAIALKPHQAYCIYWAVTRPFLGAQDLHGGFIADEMGLGKTIETIGIIVVRAWLVAAQRAVSRDRASQLSNPRHEARHLPASTNTLRQAPNARCPTEPFGIQCPCVERTMSARMAFGGSLPSGPTLIVAPPSLCQNWYAEFERFVIRGANPLRFSHFLEHSKSAHEATQHHWDTVRGTVTFNNARRQYQIQNHNSAYRLVFITSPKCIHNRITAKVRLQAPPGYQGLTVERNVHSASWGILIRDEYHKDKGEDTITSQYFTIGNLRQGSKTSFGHKDKPWKFALTGTPFDTSIRDLESHWKALESASWATDAHSLMRQSTLPALTSMHTDWLRLTNTRRPGWEEPSVAELNSFSNQLIQFLHPWMIRRMSTNLFFGQPIVHLPPIRKRVIRCRTPNRFLNDINDMATAANREFDARTAEWQEKHAAWISGGRKGREPIQPTGRGRNSGMYYYLRLAANFPAIPALRKTLPDWTFKSEEVSSVFSSIGTNEFEESNYNRNLDSLIDGSTKITKLDRIVQQMSQSNEAEKQPEKMILFSYNPATALILYIWFERVHPTMKACLIMRATPMALRQSMIDSFCGIRSDTPAIPQIAQSRVLISNLSILGTGYTINRARWVVLFDYDWVQREHDQATKRCHRIRQTETVRAFELFNMDNPAETSIKEIHAARGNTSSQAYNTTNEQLKAMAGGAEGNEGGAAEAEEEEEDLVY